VPSRVWLLFPQPGHHTLQERLRGLPIVPALSVFLCADKPHRDLQLPLEVDVSAPRMKNRMCYPSLEDLNYLLNRWKHSWAQVMDAAVRAQNGQVRRPDTPSHSVRVTSDSHLFGYPLAPLPPVE
jgi:hypothetical protein